MNRLATDRLRMARPLDHVSPLVRGDLAANVAHRIVLELRGNSATLAEHCPGLLPTAPNRTIPHDHWRALWLRPNGWLLSGAPEVPGAGWSELLRAQQEGVCRLFDLSHARVCINLRGTATAAVLAKGTPLDLRPHRFLEGHCARTWCAGFTVVFDRVADGIDVYVDSALAVAFWDWLGDAAVELGSA